nr:hypothetical protein [Tanacetum cinerariifolium]
MHQPAFATIINSGSGDGVVSQPKIPDELQVKTTGTNKGTGTIPGFPDVPKDQSKSENESWGESRDDDDDNNDDDSDDDGNDDDSNDDNDDDKEKDDYVRNLVNYESTNDENKHVDEEEYEELYKDVNVRLKDVEHGEEGKGDAEKTDVGHDDVTQETTCDQAKNDAHVTLIAALDNEIISMMNIDVHHEELSTLTPSLLIIPVTVEKDISELKQADQSTQLLATIKSQIHAMMDAYPGIRLGDSIQKTLRSYTTEFKKEAQAENERYIDLIEKSVKDIINDEVKTQLPQILPKAMSDFATLVIKSTVTESLEDIVLAKSSSQPQSTYEATASLTEFELKKILLDKMQKSHSYRVAKEHKELYNGPVKSYKLDKDLFEYYGKAYSLK